MTARRRRKIGRRNGRSLKAERVVRADQADPAVVSRAVADVLRGEAARLAQADTRIMLPYIVVSPVRIRPMACGTRFLNSM